MEKYRQITLPGFDDLDNIRKYFIDQNETEEAAERVYSLTSERFLDALENRIESIQFEDSLPYLGAASFASKKVDVSGRPTVGIKLSIDSPHRRQAETLVHEMIHVDRRQTEPEVDSMVTEHGSMSMQNFTALFPNYYFNQAVEREKEEKLVTDATSEFYDAHTTLAQLALCHVWRRSEEEQSL